MSLAGNNLGQWLQEYRNRRGLSQTAVAQQIGVTPSTINRFETGARAPGREALLAIGRALDLDRTELDRLLRSAGELPLDLIEVGIDDPDLRLCLSILADPTISAAEKEDFRWQIRLAARRWRHAPPDTGPPSQPTRGTPDEAPTETPGPGFSTAPERASAGKARPHPERDPERGSTPGASVRHVGEIAPKIQAHPFFGEVPA